MIFCKINSKSQAQNVLMGIAGIGHTLHQQEAVDRECDSADDTAGILQICHPGNGQIDRNRYTKMIDKHSDAGNQF